MVISRDVDYALRILRCLSDGEMHSISSICEKERIPRQLGNKIIMKLQEYRLVDCFKGRNGGCKLICDLEEVTMFDVLEAAGNSCSFNLCVAPDHMCPWKQTHIDSSSIHPKLAKLQEEINTQLHKVSMHELIFGA